jgi:hypothetical protein
MIVGTNFMKIGIGLKRIEITVSYRTGCHKVVFNLEQKRERTDGVWYLTYLFEPEVDFWNCLEV